MKDQSGNTTTVSYKWALDKNLILLEFQSASWNSTAMTFYDRSADEVAYIAVDDRGGSLKGTWTLDGGHPLVVYQHTSAEGQTRRVGVLHKKVDESTFQGEMYEVSDTGQLAAQPRFTVEMKRQPK
jgi:hypothetical protein